MKRTFLDVLLIVVLIVPVACILAVADRFNRRVPGYEFEDCACDGVSLEDIENYGFK